MVSLMLKQIHRQGAKHSSLYKFLWNVKLYLQIWISHFDVVLKIMFSDKNVWLKYLTKKEMEKKTLNKSKCMNFSSKIYLLCEMLQNKNKITVGIWIPDMLIPETFQIRTCLCLDFELPKMDQLIQKPLHCIWVF